MNDLEILGVVNSLLTILFFIVMLMKWLVVATLLFILMLAISIMILIQAILTRSPSLILGQ